MEQLVPENIYPLDFKLKHNMKLIRSRPYSLPKVNEEVFKKEVGRLVILGAIERSNDSEWGAPSFAQPTPKTNRVHFLSVFRNLNIQLKFKPFTMPKINENF